MNKYREKRAFTLVEILLSLTIIGVISALTIPALVQNLQDSQLRTQWKEAYTIIEQATKKALTDNNGSFRGVFQNRSDMMDKLKVYYSYTKECANGASDGNCWPAVYHSMDGDTPGWTQVPGIVLNNGMFIRFFSTNDAAATSCTEATYYSAGECGAFEVDINGFKEPNVTGKDIFWIHILSNRIRPGGVPESLIMTSAAQCGTDGAGCGALYLMQ